MNYDIVWAVLKHPNLTDKTDFAVLMAIACHTDAQGGCYLSTPTVARGARVTCRCAEIVIERLRTARYFTLRRGGGKGKTNHYQLHLQHGQIVQKSTKFAASNPEPDSVFDGQNEEEKPDENTGDNGADTPNGVRVNEANPEAHTPNCVRGMGPNPEADAKPNPEAPSSVQDKYFNGFEVSTHSARTHDAPQPSSQNRRPEQPPGEGNGDRRPFEIGADDARYHTKLFHAVLETCEIKAASLDIDPQFRAQIGGIAVALSENYTAEQIRQVKVLWPYPTAPTPRQLLREIGRIINQKPKENQANGSSQKQSGPRPAGAATQRPAGRGLGAVSKFAPGVRSRRAANGTNPNGTPGENQ